jgi:hypothetical protein
VIVVGRSIQSGLNTRPTEPATTTPVASQIDPAALKADLSNTVADALNAALLQISSQARHDREEILRDE